MNPHFHTDFSISDSLIFVRKSVLIYETIITGVTGFIGSRLSICSLLNENKGERLNESCNYNALL